MMKRSLTCWLTPKGWGWSWSQKPRAPSGSPRRWQKPKVIQNCWDKEEACERSLHWATSGPGQSTQWQPGKRMGRDLVPHHKHLTIAWYIHQKHTPFWCVYQNHTQLPPVFTQLIFNRKRKWQEEAERRLFLSLWTSASSMFLFLLPFMGGTIPCVSSGLCPDFISPSSLPSSFLSLTLCSLWSQ